jgi:hypothetical protein
MKKRSVSPSRSKIRKGQKSKDHSVGLRRDHVTNEEEHDTYFGNNDPADIANEYEHYSVYESEAGIGYVDSAYRRRKIHDMEEHNASYELYPELHSDLDEDENFSSRFDPSADFYNDHEEEARGDRHARPEENERHSRPATDRTAGEQDRDLEKSLKEDARGYEENRRRVSRRGSVHEKKDHNRGRGVNSRDRRRRH